MPNKSPKRCGRAATKKIKVKPTMFWRCKPDPEADRAGDWLLKNLSAMRANTLNRGPAN